MQRDPLIADARRLSAGTLHHRPAGPAAGRAAAARGRHLRRLHLGPGAERAPRPPAAPAGAPPRQLLPRAHSFLAMPLGLFDATYGVEQLRAIALRAESPSWRDRSRPARVTPSRRPGRAGCRTGG